MVTNASLPFFFESKSEPLYCIYLLLTLIPIFRATKVFSIQEKLNQNSFQFDTELVKILMEGRTKLWTDEDDQKLYEGLRKFG